jgi:hypothetical protein
VSEPPELGITGQELYDNTEPAHYAEPQTDYAWARFLSALALLLDPIATVTRPETGEDNWIVLASPSRCPVEWLPVLAQWAGVRRPDAMSEEALRELIGPHAPGMWRGTTQAMLEAVRRFYPPPSDPDLYRQTIAADYPAAHWSLGEAPGSTVAADDAAGYHGTINGSQTPNLLDNPSFETDLTNWGGNAGTTATHSTAQAKFGTGSAHLTRTLPAAGTYAECAIARAATAYTPVLPDQDYTLSGHVYPLSLFAPQNPWVSFSWFDADGVFIRMDTVLVAAALNTWTRISATKRSPSNAASVRCYVALYAGSSGDGVSVVEGYVDAVQLVLGDRLPPYADTQSVQLGVPGAIPTSGDTALQVNDMGGYIVVSLDPGLLSPQFSLEMWAKVDPTAPTSGASQTLWDFAWANSGHLARIEKSDASIIFFVHRSSDSNDYANIKTDGGMMDATSWHHVVCTFGADMKQRIYVDGQLRSTSPSPLASIWVPASGAIYFPGHYTELKGQVDEPAIYAYELTADQVLAHYDAGRAPYVPPNVTDYITFEERADGDPYLLRVFTYDFVPHDPELVEQALLHEKPAGLNLQYEVRSGQTWGMLKARKASWGAVMTDYASWGDVHRDLPIRR